MKKLFATILMINLASLAFAKAGDNDFLGFDVVGKRAKAAAVNTAKAAKQAKTDAAKTQNKAAK